MGLFDKIKNGAKKVASSVKNFFSDDEDFDEDISRDELWTNEEESEDFDEEICEEELCANEEISEDFEDSKKYNFSPNNEQVQSSDGVHSTVFCVKCGAKNVETAKFCFNCGESIKKEQKKFCTNCGKEIENDSLFCIHCGTKVEG